MTFLQPILLAALPLVALPVIIHLINQRRYQTIRWGAMMFLLSAHRMSRGYARLRQMLILLFRMLAIAGLIFAIGRPLASGWLGLAAGGRPDTTIVLLDRSPSMRQQGTGTTVSKLDSGKQQLSQTLETIGSGRLVLIDSAANQARDLESPAALLNVPAAEPTSTSADLPKMLEAARDYIRQNKTGRTEIWICSDIRENDWNAESGRWQTLRESFLEFPQAVRFHLLAYPDMAGRNLKVRVTNIRRRQSDSSAELLVSLAVTQEGESDSKVSFPVQLEIEGARSELTVEMEGGTFELKDHRIPLQATRERGWGKVSIPADANPADNEFYFVFDQPTPRQTLIVTDDPLAARPLELAAAISPDPAIRCSAEIISPDQLSTADWDATSLVLWQAPLPTEAAANTVSAFVQRGGNIIFLPPRDIGNADFKGVRWQDWVEQQAAIPIETWRGDQDVLANTQSGAALPVGQLEIRRYRGLTGEFTPLASVSGGDPLLARLPTDRGGVYFCATTPGLGDSSLATNGVVLYVFVQRALAAGAALLSQTRQLVAGDSSAEQSPSWHQVAGPPDAISTDFEHYGGVYTEGEKLLAVNRSTQEDRAKVLADDRIAGLFDGLDFSRVDDRAGSLAGLIQEIWRLCLGAMLIALLVEAALCLPRRPQQIRQTARSGESSQTTETRPFSRSTDLANAEV